MFDLDKYILSLPAEDAEYVLALRPDQFYLWLERRFESLTVLYGPNDDTNTLF